MDKLNESNQTLRSMVMFKRQKIEAIYLRRYKGCFERVGLLLIVDFVKDDEEQSSSGKVRTLVKCDCLKGCQEDQRCRL